VTPIAGTTRDVVELHVSIGGYPVIIADTAGLRTDASDAVEKEGITRAHAYAQQADLVILVIDATKYIAQMSTSSSVSFDSYVTNCVNELQLLNLMTTNGTAESNSLRTEKNSWRGNEASANNLLSEISGSEKCIIVLNKTDLLDDVDKINYVLQHYNGVIALSCKTENGIPQLLDKMTKNLTTL
jgi:tRNA modification GTPase